MRRLWVGVIAVLVLVVIVAAVLWSKNNRSPDQSSGPAQASAFKAVPSSSASPPDDGNWTMPARIMRRRGSAGSTEITPANVGKLQVG